MRRQEFIRTFDDAKLGYLPIKKTLNDTHHRAARDIEQSEQPDRIIRNRLARLRCTQS
jgi:hypothetical protein